jgi:hypothetical protein
MTDQVKDRPGPQRDMPRGSPAARDAGRTGEALRSGATEVRDRAAGVAEHAKEQGKDALARRKDDAASEVDSVAGALHDTADRLQHDDRSTLAPKIGRYVGYAAQQLESASRQLRDKDVDTLFDDAAALGRRSPAALFAGAAVAGFLLSRFLKSSSTRTHDDDPPVRTENNVGSSEAALLNPTPGDSSRASTGGMSAAGSSGGVGGLTSAETQPAMSTAPVSDVKPDSTTQGGRYGQ